MKRINNSFDNLTKKLITMVTMMTMMTMMTVMAMMIMMRNVAGALARGRLRRPLAEPGQRLLRKST